MHDESPRILRFPSGDSGRREHYIPLRPEELLDRLSAEPQLTILERQSLRTLGQLLTAIVHREHHQHLEAVKRDYAPYDPDAQAERPAATSQEAYEGGIERVFTGVDYLLQRANFRQLSQAELEASLTDNSQWGMAVRVDFSIFRRLAVYVRGDSVGQWDVQSWKTNFKKVNTEVPIYERLALMFCLRDDIRLPKGMAANGITLKLFKNIPQMDVEMLLPGTEARMTWLDKAQIAVPTASGIGLALFKILKGAVVVAFASVYSTLILLSFIGGTIGYAVKSFFGYLNVKERYQHSLTRRLYFQNLDNNAGVLFRLLDEAEEQDFREAFLAWYLLWQSGSRNGWTATQIDEAAEARLSEWLGFEVDFEVADALEKLQRLGLAHRIGPQRWQAVSLPVALMRLERHWRDSSPLEAQLQQRRVA